VKTEPITINLDKPLVGHKGPIDKVVIRPPTFNEYMEHGDPFIWVPLENGTAFASETPEVVSAYAKILVVEPQEKLLLEQGGFPLAKKIRQAIGSFFLPDSEDKKV
jgi:hypothetical protein